MKPLHLLVPALLLATLPSIASADTGRAAVVETMTVEVELTESTAKNAAETVMMTLSLAGERGCASVETSQSALSYQLTVCRDGGDLAAPLMTFAIERTERTKDGPTFRKLRVASRITAGTRVVVGKIARGGSDATEIAAQIQ